MRLYNEIVLPKRRSGAEEQDLIEQQSTRHLLDQAQSKLKRSTCFARFAAE